MPKSSREKSKKHVTHDIDPEDLDSNYTSSLLLTSKHKSGLKNKAREHLGDVKYLKRNVNFEEGEDDDDIERFGEKYRGERKSRKELGFESSDIDEVDEYLSMEDSDMSTQNEDEDESLNSDDVEAELRRIEDEDVLHQPKMFATPKTTLAESGRALRAHYKSYSEAMETRSRLQPLLGLANRFGDQSKMGLNMRKELGMKQVLLDIIPNSDDTNNPSMKRIWHVMEQEHLKLMQEAQSVLDSEYIVPTGKSNVKKMKVINQSVWSQVQLALQDKDRLLERMRKRRVPGSEQMLEKMKQGNGEEETHSVFDDHDFFTVQVRDWIASLGSAMTFSTGTSANTTVLFNANNKKKKPVERKTSKGRRLKFDTHELLIGLCAPRRNGNAWGDDRVDDLCRSLLGGMITKIEAC